jgi:hypothetical protein
MNKHNVPVPEETVLGVHRGIFMLGLVSFLSLRMAWHPRVVLV